MNKPQDTKEVPPVIGDFGQDDAFATESHPEGLLDGERPHAPGALPHPELEPGKADDKAPPPHGEISIG